MPDSEYEQFHQLVIAIERQSSLMSPSAMMHFPAFTNLLAMGDAARKFICQDMRRGTYKWLYITLLQRMAPNMNPCSNTGGLKEMSEDWLRLADIKKW